MQSNHSRSGWAWLVRSREWYRHCMEWMLSCTKWSTVSFFVWFLKEMRNRNLFLLRQRSVVCRWLSHIQQRIGYTEWGKGWLTAFFFWNYNFSDIFNVNILKLYLICSYNGMLGIWYFADQNDNLEIKINNT